jgi:regulator of sigma E protease
MSLIGFLVPFVLVLGILILFHEIGHFVAAKALGVKVERFSIGFGPSLYSWTRGETEYRIAWIFLLGGYVKMTGEVPGEVPDESVTEADRARMFTSKPAWQRITISVAGPAMNFVLPLFLLSGAYMVGVPTPTARVGAVVAGSPAAAAGLQAGDRIVSIGGQAIEWQAIEWWAELVDGLEERTPLAVALEVSRRGETLRVALDLSGAKDDLKGLGLSPVAPAALVAISGPHTPAARAGLRTGDQITRWGERDIRDWPALVEAAEGVSGPVELELARAVEGSKPETIRVKLQVESRSLDRLGILTGDLLVHEVETESPAEVGGLQAGDLVLAAGGKPLGSFQELAQRIRATEGSALSLRVLREGRPLALQVIPVERVVVNRGLKDRTYAIGVRGGAPGGAELGSLRVNPLRAVVLGTEWSWQIIVRTFEGIGMLISGRVGREGLAGPIGIGVIAAQSFQAGWVQGILIMAVISINLGILNLLPVPILDGGHILFALVEGAKGSPVSFRTREIGQQIGLTLLVLLMVFAFWNDFSRYWSDIVLFFTRG